MNISAKIRGLFRRRPLSCEEVNQFIIDYLEGTMSEPLRTRFKSHLSDCPNCEAFLRQYETTVELSKEQATFDPPEELIDRTLSFLREHYDDEL